MNYACTEWANQVQSHPSMSSSQGPWQRQKLPEGQKYAKLQPCQMGPDGIYQWPASISCFSLTVLSYPQMSDQLKIELS